MYGLPIFLIHHILDIFATDSSYNFDKYSNQAYDELIHQVKTDLAGNETARWEAMKQAEKYY